MDILHMFARFMQEGGCFMYPILLVLALGLAIAVERFIYLNNTKNSNVRVWNQLLPLIETGKYREAIPAAADSNAADGKILAYGLSRLRFPLFTSLPFPPPPPPPKPPPYSPPLTSAPFPPPPPPRASTSSVVL